MYSPLVGFIALISFFALMLFLVIIGQRIGKKKTAASALGVTEGAVFTLMALLVAFTFTSASQRLDQRRALIIEEANAISTSFLRLDILQPKDFSELKKDFVTYLDSRLAIYQAVPDFKAVDIALEKSKKIQSKLWKDAVKACNNTKNPVAFMVLLPSINNMFDIASLRIAYTKMHPPVFVFILLLIVALLSALLTGYSMAGKEAWLSIYILSFIIITSVTLYTIIDLEFPRLGMIQETHFDTFLIELKKKHAGSSVVK